MATKALPRSVVAEPPSQAHPILPTILIKITKSILSKNAGQLPLHSCINSGVRQESPRPNLYLRRSLCNHLQEALVSSLRSHLARLISVLSEHRAILTESHSLREKDAIALRESQLGWTTSGMKLSTFSVGEVEDLCGVVEEGLREQRWSWRDPADSALMFLMPQKTRE
ncbi:hypothetical protein JOM56_000826 [Amanita muscaria]